MKEIKVKLYHNMNDSFVELYKVIEGETNSKYFARYCWKGGGEWSYVSDPLGYCELDHSCSKDMIFVVCDQDGNELFKDSNGEISNPFPTLEDHAKNIWNTIKEKYSTKEGLNDWLLSFLTKDKITKDMTCPYENWKTFWYDETKKEVIKKFDHLGVKYCIYKATNKHRYCDCEWIEYFSGLEAMDEYDNYVAHYGSWFDDSIMGDCYSPRQAHRLVVDVLKEIYGEKKYRISNIVKHSWGGVSEQRMSLDGAADYLINCVRYPNSYTDNFNRNHIDSIIEKERKEKSFYCSKEEILKDYDAKEVDWDYTLSY